MADVVTAQSEPAADEAARRDELRRVNSRWLATHAPEWYEPYEGRWIAVSRGEVFVADDEATARGLALAAHPDDEPMLTHILKVYTYLGRKGVLAEQHPQADRIQQMDRFQRNLEWLDAQGSEFLERFRGRSIAVANGEVFVADDVLTARNLALARYPDEAPYYQRIPLDRHARIYAS